MARSEMPLGFIAFWKHTDTWYAESEAKKAEFQKELEGIFEEYKDKGIKMYGEFDCWIKSRLVCKFLSYQ